MSELEALTKWLVSADTAMVAVTFFMVQVVKFFIPSPIPEIPGAAPDRWRVVKELQWLPFAAAFILGTLLSVIFDPDKGELIVSKFRGGLQTGAYSVAVWELYSTAIKPIVDKILGKP